MKNRNLNHKDDWKTPPYIYDPLNKEFNFNFDPCPYQHDLNEWDGLKIDWKERVFINPPYSVDLKKEFVLKAISESKKGKLCVMLLPVSTSTKLFHNYILPNKKDIRFVERRIKFHGVNTKGVYVTNGSAMHDSMVVIFDGRIMKKTIQQAQEWYEAIENYTDRRKLQDEFTNYNTGDREVKFYRWLRDNKL